MKHNTIIRVPRIQGFTVCLIHHICFRWPERIQSIQYLWRIMSFNNSGSVTTCLEIKCSMNLLNKLIQKSTSSYSSSLPLDLNPGWKNPCDCRVMTACHVFKPCDCRSVWLLVICLHHVTAVMWLLFHMSVKSCIRLIMWLHSYLT